MKDVKNSTQPQALIPYHEKKIFVSPVWSNGSLKRYAKTQLTHSLTDIGFSKDIINALWKALDIWDFDTFYNRFADEIDNVYRYGFFQVLVPSYFDRYVIPLIPPRAGRILDVGCGTGILAKRIISQNQSATVIGIDLHPYREWREFASPRIQFKTVHGDAFADFLWTEKFDACCITWTLHHMSFAEQESYLRLIHENIPLGCSLVVLEDGYSAESLPLHGAGLCKIFFALPAEDRQKIMSFYDWIANRVLARRSLVPIPCTYRTLEEWKELFIRLGYEVSKETFIGFPQKRDICTPQIAFVATKITIS